MPTLLAAWRVAAGFCYPGPGGQAGTRRAGAVLTGGVGPARAGSVTAVVEVRTAVVGSWGAGCGAACLS